MLYPKYASAGVGGTCVLSPALHPTSVSCIIHPIEATKFANGANARLKCAAKEALLSTPAPYDCQVQCSLVSCLDCCASSSPNNTYKQQASCISTKSVPLHNMALASLT